MSRTKPQIINFYAGVLHEAVGLTDTQYDAVRTALAFACSEIEENSVPAFAELHNKWADANNEAVRLKKANEEAEEEIGRLCSLLQAIEAQPAPAATIVLNGTHPAPPQQVAGLVAQLITIDAATAQEAAADDEAQPDPTTAPTKPGANDRKPFAFTWGTLDDTSLQIANNLDAGKTAWRLVNLDDKRVIALAVVKELQLDMPPGETLTIAHYDQQRPIWMPSFPSLSTGVGMTWKQMLAAAPQL